MNTDESLANKGLSKGLLWLMAVTACFVVANNNYNQPLLGEIAREFNVSEGEAGKVATTSLLGYSIGLLLLVPLGDKFRKKRIIVADFLVIIASLLFFAWSPTIELMMLAGFLIGLSSVVPQMMVPLAAQLSKPKDRNENVALVMSGLLIGILGARVLSGFVSEYFGWRQVYYIAAGLMLVLWMLNILLLPDIKPTFYGSYSKLMKSIVVLIKERPDLRLASLRGGLSLAAFQAFWTTLTFHLERPPFFAGSEVAGSLGLVGIGGAVAASLVGKVVDKVGGRTIITYGSLTMLVAWLIMGVWGMTYVGLIIGIFWLDVGLQSIHVTNQTVIFSKNPEATNRLNTVYMTCYFVGGSLGAYFGGKAWSTMGWMGTVLFGSTCVVLLLLVHLISGRDKK